MAAACASTDDDTTTTPVETGDGTTTTSATDAGSAGEDIEEVVWALPEIPDTLFVPFAWTTYEGAIMALAQEGL
ncbi:MAG: hypothetical protein ACE1Z9_09360, partial [Acidimicrobiia bacterium]